MISLPFASTSTGGKNGGREVYPLPFREPVSTAPTVALEFHHAAAALRASRLMIDKMMLELDSPAGVEKTAWLISDRSLKFTVATTARPVTIHCKPKTNSRPRVTLEKTAIPGELQLHCRYR
jgi:hypothetical protein